MKKPSSAGYIAGTQVLWQSGGTCMAHSASQRFTRISAMPIKLKSTSRLSRSCPVAKADMIEYGLYGPRLCGFSCIPGLISYRALRDIAAAQKLVVDLLEAVIPAIIMPLHEDGPVINARAV